MRWKTLQHNGILFSPPYEQKGIKVRIRGKPVKLDALQEEMIYQWAKKKDTPYILDRVFQDNFTADLAKMLGLDMSDLKYDEIDFADAYRLVDRERIKRVTMSKEDRKELREQRKKIREKLKEQYGTAVMDSQKVEVASYMAEPPGIFIGRGKHPLRGRWKPRVGPEDVILNLDSKAKVPPGGWGDVVHEKKSMWLAKWTDSLTGKRKYIWLADTAKVKQDMDKGKYNKAIKLSKEIGVILDCMERDMAGGDEKKAKVATVCYLIYLTAMRVGDEKDADEADTVGATTLRKEHVKVSGTAIEFDFLGKDSVRWQEKLTVEKCGGQFRDNMAKMVSGKKRDEEIFQGITSRSVNRYLGTILKGLTAKVFRTYLASATVTAYLKKNGRVGKKSAYQKIHAAKMANLEAAKLCNHKRTIPKTFEGRLQRKGWTLNRIKGEIPWSKSEQALKNVKQALAKAEQALAKAKDSNPKTERQKASAKRRVATLRKTVKSRKERVSTLRETIRTRKQRHQERVEKARLQIELAKRTREHNLGTSLRNYIDPRIFRFWTESVGAEWEKLYTAALQKKFLWVKSERGSWKSISGKY